MSGTRRTSLPTVRELRVDQVGRGTLLAGRYRVLEPEQSTVPVLQTWAAVDEILDRPVRAQVLAPESSDAGLDAARRAALVTDPRLLRILDVGTHDGLGYVVSEQVSGPSLAQLVVREPLTADQARSVVGEASAALEVARRRGVHHEALRPSAVSVADDGRVLVSGLALDAALLGRMESDARTTSRADAVDLVRLLYTALTGRWPGPSAAADGVPLAPVVDGAPVAPTDLVPGVPADLDTLCAVTLGPHDDGPHSPAEVVRELEPWGEIRISRRSDQAGSPAATGGSALAAAAGAAAAAAEHGGASAAPAKVTRQSVRNAFTQSTPGAGRPGTPPPAAPGRTSAFPAVTPPPSFPAQPAPAQPFPAQPSPAPAPPFPGPDAGRSAGAPAAPAAGTSRPPVFPATVSTARPPFPDPKGAAAQQGTGGAARPVAPLPVFPPTAQGPTAQGPTAQGPTTQGPVPQPPAARPAPLAPASIPPAAAVARAPRGEERVAGRPPADDDSTAPQPPVAATVPRRSAAPRPAAVPPAVPPVGARPPFVAEEDPFEFGRVPDEPSGRRRFDPTVVVLAVVVLVVIVGVALAAKALLGGPSLRLTGGTGSSSHSASASGSHSSSASASPSASNPASGGAPVIASATSVDLNGTQGDHPEAVPKAIDGDPSTFWMSLTYKTAAFGGLKQGIGYVLTLKQPTTVSSVTLHVNGTGGSVEIRATDAANPAGGTVLASGALSGDATFTLKPATSTGTLSLWFTQLPTTSDGSFRVELTEVQLG